MVGVYHDFYDDTGNIHYGKECDFSVAKKIGKHYSLLARYAYYSADYYSTDTQKYGCKAILISNLEYFKYSI